MPSNMPAMDFYSMLSGLGDTFQSNRKIAQEQALRDSMKDMPRRTDGSIDFDAVGNTIAANGGDMNQVLAVAKLAEEQRKNRAELAASGRFGQTISGIFGGAPATAGSPAIQSPAASDPGPPSVAPRAPVMPSAKVWGDKEAEDAGLYEPKPAPTSTSFGSALSGKRPDPYEGMRTPAAAPVQPVPPTQAAITAPVAAAPAAKSGFDGIGIQHAPALVQALSDPRLPAGQREIAGTLLKRALDDAKEPDRVRFLQSLKDRPDLLEIEKSLRAKTEVTTNIDQRGETEEAKAAGKAAGERRAAMFGAADTSARAMSGLTRVETLLDQVAQGKLEPGRMTISAWAKSFGVNDDFAKSIGLDPKKVGDAQAVQALVNELVIGKLGPGGFPSANFSDSDRAFLTDIFPKLGNDPRANKILIESARRIHQDNIQRSLDYQTWKEDPTNKSRSFEDFEVNRARKISQMDRFGDLRKQAEALIGSSETPSGQINGISWRQK